MFKNLKPLTIEEREKIFERLVAARNKRDSELWEKYSVITAKKNIIPMSPVEREQKFQQLIIERELRDDELARKYTKK